MIASALSSGVTSIYSGVKLLESSAQTIARQSITSPDPTATSPGTQQTGTSGQVSSVWDMAEPLVDQRQALYQVQAGAKVISTTGKMLGSLLDVFA
ncbi:MAG TPA: hypothetical protein PKY50_11200 [Candidatus Competibacter sp.]|nr:hypothetical protein [Candidatus Competibacter sp.]